MNNKNHTEVAARAPRSNQVGDWQGYYTKLASDWTRKQQHVAGYRGQVLHYLRYCVPEGSRVLEIGCAHGDILAGLKPSRGVGIDFVPAMIEVAKQKHPESHLEFLHAAAETFESDEIFDYIILENLLCSLEDVEFVLHRIARCCNPQTRLVMNFQNTIYEPVHGIAAAMGLRRPQPIQNWISQRQIANLLHLTGFALLRLDNRHLFPFDVPLLTPLFENYLGRLPLVRHLGMMTWAVARLVPKQARMERPRVSVVCPCRNEAGNIHSAAARLPEMGGSTELIFVEGNSTDDTWAQCEAAIRDFPEKDIKLIAQGAGKGKGDAVRKGFAAATGDILMILDADLTVPPEDLPKFVHALLTERGEFINGTRLVYPMEREAMRFLNKLGNKGFSIIFTWILGQPLTDTLCGTKVLWTSDYQRLAANRCFFGDFDPFGDFDLIFGAAKLGLHIVEVPVRYRDRTYGATNISRFRHGWLLLQMSTLAARRVRFY